MASVSEGVGVSTDCLCRAVCQSSVLDKPAGNRAGNDARRSAHADGVLVLPDGLFVCPDGRHGDICKNDTAKCGVSGGEVSAEIVLYAVVDAHTGSGRMALDAGNAGGTSGGDGGVGGHSRKSADEGAGRGRHCFTAEGMTAHARTVINPGNENRG